MLTRAAVSALCVEPGGKTNAHQLEDPELAWITHCSYPSFRCEPKFGLGLSRSVSLPRREQLEIDIPKRVSPY